MQKGNYFVLIGILLLCSVVVQAQQSNQTCNPWSEINRGDALWRDPTTRGYAPFAYGEAKRCAAKNRDWSAMLALSQRYLGLSNEAEGWDCLGLARIYSYDWAVYDPARPNSGANCGYGRAGLTAVVNAWNSTLNGLAASASQNTRSGMFAIAQGAWDNLQWLNYRYGAGCPPVPQTPSSQVALDAQAGNNSLAGNNKTRGFGDSNEVDVWVPFNFSFSRPTYRIISAKIIMVVKPIEQLIGTDQLVIRGASGSANNVFTQFNTLKPKAWNTVEVDLTQNADVMAALQNGGRIECLIQDDTAVASVKLVLTFR